MFTVDLEASVGEYELPDPGRFNRHPVTLVYVGGRGHAPITLPHGGGSLSEFVAIAADREGRVQALVVRSHVSPPLGASGDFAYAIWNAAIGGKPFFRPGGNDSGGWEESYLIAHPETPGLEGRWKLLVVMNSLVLYAD